jgi:choloylglycine hydrolase
VLRFGTLASVLLLAIALASCSPESTSRPDITSLSASDASAEGHGCTSFCLTTDGTCIFGTNHDNSVPEGILYINKRGVEKTGWDESTSGEVASWTSKYGSVTFNLVGYQYPWGGMNEAGLVISTMALEESQMSAPDGRPPTDISMWVQYQLDTSSSVEQVLASESSVRVTSALRGCCHYLVCDRSGACATIEFLEGETVIHAGGSLPVAALANSTYQDSIQAWQEAAEELAQMEDRVNSLRRFAIAASAVTDFRPSDSEAAVRQAFEVLGQASNEWTAWTMVFDPENLEVYFRSRWNSKIRSIDFADLEFECETPVLMLNIHEDLAGDVSQNLRPYSHEISLDHFFLVLNKLGLGSSRSQLDSLLQRIEDFPCASGQVQISQPDPSASVWVWSIGGATLVILSLAANAARRSKPVE